MSWQISIEIAGGTMMPLCTVMDLFALFAVLESLQGSEVAGPEKIQILRLP